MINSTRVAKERARLDWGKKEAPSAGPARQCSPVRHLGFASFAEYIERLFGYGTTRDRRTPPRRQGAREPAPNLQQHALRDGSVPWSTGTRAHPRCHSPRASTHGAEALRGRTLTPSRAARGGSTSSATNLVDPTESLGFADTPAHGGSRRTFATFHGGQAMARLAVQSTMKAPPSRTRTKTPAPPSHGAPHPRRSLTPTTAAPVTTSRSPSAASATAAGSRERASGRGRLGHRRDGELRRPACRLHRRATPPRG